MQAIRPAYQNQILVNRLQNELHNTAKLEWLYKEKLLNLQVGGLQQQVKNGEKRERKATWKGIKIGGIAGFAFGVAIGIFGR